MTRPSRTKFATEDFVWRVVNGSEGRLDKRIDGLENKMDKRFDKAMTVLDSIAGQFKKFDEERLLLSDHSRDHGDRIEKLEKKVFKVAQI